MEGLSGIHVSFIILVYVDNIYFIIFVPKLDVRSSKIKRRETTRYFLLAIL